MYVRVFSELSFIYQKCCFIPIIVVIIIIIVVAIANIIMFQLDNANKEASQAEDKLATTLYILQAKLLS